MHRLVNLNELRICFNLIFSSQAAVKLGQIKAASSVVPQCTSGQATARFDEWAAHFLCPLCGVKGKLTSISHALVY